MLGDEQDKRASPMTDTSFSSASLRMQRSRNPSGGTHARTSYHDDNASLRLPSAISGGGSGGQHSLRSQSSRFSLSEHFAATRSLYEFGFDDASSYAAPSVVVQDGPTTATTATTEEDGPVSEEQRQREELEALLEGDFYDVLCLPRDRGAALAREDVRRAYHRMFLLFYPETYPDAMRGIAKRQFERAQEGFEVLVDEGKRRAYDQGIGVETEQGTEATSDWREIGISSEVGVRVDASRGLSSTRPLDFTVGHSSTAAVPYLASHLLDNLRRFGLTTSIPAFSLSSSIYGIIPPMSALPLHLLSSPHQPLRPAASPRHRLLQLSESKLSPHVGARLTHEMTRTSRTDTAWLGTQAEYGIDVLPNLAPSIRLFHHLRLLPDAETPTILETSIRGRSWWSTSEEQGTPPRAAMGVHHLFPHGTAFARVDSGDWNFTPEACRFMTSTAVAEARQVSYADFPLQVAPIVELGFTTASEAPGSASWNDTPDGASHNLSLLNSIPSSNTGTWTASTAIHPFTNLTTSISYTTPSLPILSSSSLQVDLSASTTHPSTLSLRHLIPITTSTNIGLELSLSRFSTHLSLHLTRLNRRLSLPLFFPPVDRLEPQTLFVVSAVPFLVLAAFKFITRASKRRKQQLRKPQDTNPMDTSSPTVQAAIAHRREEADHSLVSSPTPSPPKHHASHGNLVILSAKFGLPADADPSDNISPSITLNNVKTSSALPLTFHPDEEIADVTVALAALVDDRTGRLWIPDKVRKGCIPGFWDPAPGRDKLLLVRYSFRGREDMVAVRGEEELILPPK
ncbi:LOW QUALITY PROTEIN: hypothetical protein NLU13_8258 [Sarocladium strictum]|uniref:J domain-containing protein n=1 Tax=Sarocladium strictum TaxID=5046 RepID=A0AA39L4Z6_SARSR|nr:LOW QUALITY PROTEIN: hypothetical protein NLU13_8258 [Sarocladium strictum]